ncbi:MAG: metallophosphoesterase [Clostridiales bacterium]|nr:metallophosphoesterase [Clostridiales bacterium]
MKKIFSILLIVIIAALLCLPLVSCNNKISYDYAFISDLHVVASSKFTKENFVSYTKRQKLLHISEAILHSLVDELIQKKYKYVFVGGDITEYGDEESHLVAAAAFDKLKRAGCKVFVINGNHDLPVNKGEVGKKINPARFREIYKEFGYEQAVEKSPNTLSYAANVNKKYRVIGVDNMIHYGQDEIDVKASELSDAHIRWIEGQVNKCIEDKVTPIIFAHDTMLDHYPPFVQAALNRKAGAQFNTLTKSIADKGAKFIFSGHDHIQDISSLKTENDNELYEVSGASMTLYPLTYREMSFNKKKVVINTCSFDNLNVKYLPPFSDDSLKKELENGLQTYCYNHFYHYINNLVTSAPDALRGMSLPTEAKQTMQVFADGVVDKIINNPFYKNKENDNISLQRILENYDIDLPESEYKSLADLAPIMVMKLLAGDENFVGGPELSLIKYTIFSIFYYIQQQSQYFAELWPELLINIDLPKLFNKGILEAYDSNLMPFLLEVIKSIDKTIGSALSIFSQNFDKISDSLVLAIISGYTNDIVDNLDEYFVGRNVLLGKLIDQGLWERYGAGFVQDIAPSDTYFEVELEK